MTLRRATRVILIALCALTLGGCETSSFWDGANNASDKVQDMLGDFSPFGTSKKPLPGDRRAVFPEGVPGVQQGVPQELMRGSQQQPGVDAPQPPAQAAVPPPAPAPEPKAKSKKVAKKSQAKKPAGGSDPPEDDVWPPPPSR